MIRSFGRLAVLSILCSLAAGLAFPAPVKAQSEFKIPRAAQPELRPPQLAPPQLPQYVPTVEIPKSAPVHAPAGAQKVRFILKGLDIEGVTAYPRQVIEGFYKKLLGTEVTLKQVYDIAQRIEHFYRKNGYFLARTIIPAQTVPVSIGRLRIQVLEGYISKVLVEGNIGPVVELVREYLKDLPNERPLKLKSLERYLLLTNDIPGLVAKGVLRPSVREVGAAELVVTVERHPFNAVLSTDNYGSSFTGEWEAAANLSANSFSRFGESLTLNAILSEPFDLGSNNQKVVQLLSSIHPWSNGLYIKLMGSYGKSNPGGDIGALEMVSTQLLVSPTVGYPIIRSRDRNLFVEMSFDYINNDADLFNNIAFFRDKLRVLNLKAFGNARDSWGGVSSGSLGLRQGLPILDASESGDTLLSRPNASGVFTTVSATLSRLQPISGPFSLLLKAGGQYAFNTVLIDEEFGVGSFNFGRGYDPNALSDDSGVGFTGELQYTKSATHKYLKSYQFFTFYDFGQVWNHDTGDSASLCSVGGGVRAWLTTHFSVELTGAKPVGIRSQRADDTRDAQFLFRAVGGF